MVKMIQIPYRNLKIIPKNLKCQPEPHLHPIPSPVSTLPSTIVPANISEHPERL